MNKKSLLKILAALMCVLLACSCALAEDGSEICDHAVREYTGGTQTNKEIVDNKDGTHTRSFDVIHYYTCQNCGDVEERYIERGSEEESHHWKADGTCADGCGALCSHNWSNQNGTCATCGAVCSHNWSEATCTAARTCSVCGTTEGEALGHNWSEATCTAAKSCSVCGATEGEALGHSWNEATCTTAKNCSVCGATEGEVLGHDWSNKDGQCAACGELCSPHNIKPVDGYDSDETYVRQDADVHGVQVTHYTTLVCSTCGYTTVDEVTEIVETRPHGFSDGVCSDCGYECQHESTTEKQGEENTGYISKDDYVHTKTVTVLKTVHCDSCEMVTGSSFETVSETDEAHNYVDGVCVVAGCNYMCPHPSKEPTGNESDTLNDCVATDDYTHVDYYTNHIEKKCNVCGDVFIEDADGQSPELPHEYERGVCTGCKHECAHPEVKDELCQVCGTDLSCQHPQDGMKLVEENHYRLSENSSWTSDGKGNHTANAQKGTLYACGTCGWKDFVADSEAQTYTFPCQEDEDGDGKCDVCGWTLPCEHKSVTTEEDSYYKLEGDSKWTPDGKGNHVAMAQHGTLYTCNTCGEEIFDAGSPVQEFILICRDLMLVDGLCDVCGWEIPCEHAGKELKEQDIYYLAEDSQWTSDGKGNHSARAALGDLFYCPDCEEDVFVGTAYQDYTFPCQEDEDGDGACDVCGWEIPCEHKNKTVVEENTYQLVDGSQWTSDGKGNHTAKARYGTSYTCDDCDDRIFEGSAAQDYTFPCQEDEDGDGKCDVCGWEFPCEHKNKTVVAANIYKLAEGSRWTSDGKGNHAAMASHGTSYTCDDCGEALFEGTEQQEYVLPCDSDGDSILETEYEVVDGGTIDMDKRHRKISTTTTLCSVCEYEVSRVETSNIEEDHSYNGEFACGLCGHACAHSTRRPTDMSDPDKQYDTLDQCVATDDYTHLDYYTNYTEVTCPDCGKVYFEGTPGVSPQLEHSYKNGVCEGCKHTCAHPLYTEEGKCDACAMPKATPTPAPKPTPAPDNDHSSSGGNGGGQYTGGAVVEEEEEDVVFEPTPAPTQAPAMVEKLMEAVTEAEEAGSTVNIEVVGAQEVMTEAEYTELKQLNAQEQILVTLASIGFEDVVTAAMETMNGTTLSEQAQTLMASVSERMSDVTPQEKEELEAKLNEYFPVREIEVEGKTYPYFIMELQVEVDGVVTMQYYGFRMDENGEWIFVMLREEDL